MAHGTAAYSAYLSDRLFDYYFRGFTPPAITAYAALLTALPTRNNDGAAVEVVGNGYARVLSDPRWGSSINSGALGPSSSVIYTYTYEDGADYSTFTAIRFVSEVFPAPTGAWGSVVGGAIYDAPIGGNLICWWAFPTPYVVDASSNQPSLSPTLGIDLTTVLLNSVRYWEPVTRPFFNRLLMGGAYVAPPEAHLLLNLTGGSVLSGARMPTALCAQAPDAWEPTEGGTSTGASAGGRTYIRNAVSLRYPLLTRNILSLGADVAGLQFMTTAQTDNPADPSASEYAVSMSIADYPSNPLLNNFGAWAAAHFSTGKAPRIPAGGLTIDNMGAETPYA